MDEFRHDETDYALLGQKTKRKFRMGDKIKIKVVATNLEKRQMDFELLQDNKKTGNKAAIKKIPAKRKNNDCALQQPGLKLQHENFC